MIGMTYFVKSLVDNKNMFNYDFAWFNHLLHTPQARSNIVTDMDPIMNKLIPLEQ